MVGWHHPFNGHGFEQAPGDSEGQEVWHAAVHRATKSQTWLNEGTISPQISLLMPVPWTRLIYETDLPS